MPHARPLIPDEIALFPHDFTRQFDIASVRLIDRAHNPFALGKILVRGSRIYWPSAPADFTREPLARQALLMHELCHVWQYATRRLSAWRYLTRPRNWIYGYDIRLRNFDAHAIERQADLLQDWYIINKGDLACRFAEATPRPTRDEINAVVPFHFHPLGRV